VALNTAIGASAPVAQPAGDSGLRTGRSVAGFLLAPGGFGRGISFLWGGEALAGFGDDQFGILPGQLLVMGVTVQSGLHCDQFIVRDLQNQALLSIWKNVVSHPSRN